MNKIKNYVPYSTLKSIYYALVYPYLNYCNLVWGGTFPTHLHPLLILKKKALRAMNNKPFYFHTNELFLDGFLLKLDDIYKFRLCSYMYNHCSLLEYNRAHNYATRNRELLLPSFQRLSVTQKSLFYMGPSIWNSIPNSIRTVESFYSFRKKLRKYLIDSYNI